MKLNKGKQGISLIVLVITIIVMIIIAATIILTLDGNNIVGRASEARAESDEAALKEAASVFLGEYNLKVFKKKIDPNEVSAEEYIKENLAEEGFPKELLENLVILQNGTIKIMELPKIPEGFIMSIYDGEKTIDEGLVIYETDSLEGIDRETAMKSYNQYVWVPVNDISEFVIRDGYQDGSLQTKVSSGRNTEPYSFDTKITETNDLTGEYAEYAKMKASVSKYGGFYIARYEAGTSVERVFDDDGNGTSKDLFSQKDKYVYNYVCWGASMTNVADDFYYRNRNMGKGAVALARSIFPESSNKEVVSTLIYGVQWDAVMNFMKDIENPNVQGKKYIEDSTGMGWYGDYGTPCKTGTDIDTKSSNMVKNIYDMAGNAQEFTMEAAGTESRATRSGTKRQRGAYAPVSHRFSIWIQQENGCDSQVSFRVALYLK